MPAPPPIPQAAQHAPTGHAAVRWLDEDSPGAAQRPTELTRGLLNALDRPAVASITPATLPTILAGLVTAGIYPAYALPRKWIKTLRWHRNILWHLAEWAKVTLGEEGGQKLHDVGSARAPLRLAHAARACAVVSLVAMGIGVIRGLSLSSFWFASPADWQRAPSIAVFQLGLLAAAGLTWLSVNLNLRRLDRARRALEEATPHLPPTPGLPVGRWEWGIRPVSATLGVVLAFMGFLWALPLLIAATAQRRALLIHHRRVRQRMAHRVRELIEGRRPAIALPPVVDRVMICRNAVCDQALPPDARFCARCGTPQRPIARVLE